MSTVLTVMEKFQKQMRADIKAGKVWRYYNSKVSGTFDAAEKNANYRANCATIANWCFRKLKVFKSGNYFWGKLGGTLICSEATLKVLKANCKLIHVNGKKTVSKLIEDGTLRAGDIVTYVDLQHTNIYAGGNTWYDAGHAYCKESGEGAKFITWCGGTVYGDQKVAYIIRYNGNAEPEPAPTPSVIYRVQVGAYEKKGRATDCASTTEKRSGYKCFTEKAADGLYHVYCGSFEDKTNAWQRKDALEKIAIPAIIKEVTK